MNDIITLADVRLAILAETLADEKFVSDIEESMPASLGSTRPPDVAQIEREWRRYAQHMEQRQREKEAFRHEGIVKPLISGKIYPELDE